ncbi:ketoacyl-ACP synthase III [Phocaeicola sp.]
MAFLHTTNLSIKGIAACVPKMVEENRESSVFHSTEECEKFIQTTGIERRRRAADSICTSDLCLAAAEKLLIDLKWQKETVDCLIFVTQTPDYILPATSCILQNKLGLNEDCYTLDISLGCSGWVYGLSVLSSLLTSGMMKRGILLCGDTTLKPTSSLDKSAWPLFGDAGTATAIEYDTDSPMGFQFHLATDGSGYKAIIIPDGGYRNQVNASSFNVYKQEDGIARNRLQTILNGMDVFSFGISKAPQSINKLLEHINKDKCDVDYFLFHQANLFMNEKIRKKLKLKEIQVPYSLKDYGNTSSATIPLTLVTQLQSILQKTKLSHVGCGFGVGLSWGSVYFETEKIVCPNLIEL